MSSNPFFQVMTPPNLVKYIRFTQKSLKMPRGSMTVNARIKARDMLTSAQEELRERIALIKSPEGLGEPRLWNSWNNLPVKILPIYRKGRIMTPDAYETTVAKVRVMVDGYSSVCWYDPVELQPIFSSTLWEIPN